MGFNEMCAYLHAAITAPGAAPLSVRIRYDDHYCHYFEDHRSTWTLVLSDRLRRTLGDEMTLTIDGRSTRVPTAARQTLEIPAGVGEHTVTVRP